MSGNTSKYQIIKLSDVDSTNNFAMNYLKESIPKKPLVIVADNQTEGKGQRGNKWMSEPGKNLMCSIIDYPIMEVKRYFELNMLVSLALIQTLEKFKIEAQIKWPNDIYVQDKKIAGILIENQLRGDKIIASVFGIGLNVNQIEFKNMHAISMQSITALNFEIDEVLIELLKFIELEMMFFQLNQIDLNRQRYMKKLYRLNVESKFKDENSEFTGVIKGVAIDGRLMIERVGELKTYEMKEVSFII